MGLTFQQPGDMQKCISLLPRYAAVRLDPSQIGLHAALSQVGIILGLELTLLPALHGCWVDICLLPLTASTLSDRLLWFQVSPVSFLLAHWTLGMTVLMISATFLSIFCQQLRPGISEKALPKNLDLLSG